MDNLLKLSVIVPIYNVEKYLDKCLNSIVNQTYGNLEIILIDDGSVDKSYKIYNSYINNDNRIKLIKTRNRGIGATRNTGLDSIKGDYITFVDSDDFIELDMFEQMMNKIIKNNADILQLGHRIVSEKGDKIKDVYGEKFIFNGKDKIMNEYFNQGFINHVLWGKIYKKRVWDNVRMVSGKNNEDYMILPEVLINCEKIIGINDIKYNYVQRNNSIMNTKFNEKKLDSLFAANYVIEFCKKKSDKNTNKAIIQKCMIIIYLYLELLNSKDAKYEKIKNTLIQQFEKEYQNIEYSNDYKSTRKKNKVLIELFKKNKVLTALIFNIYSIITKRIRL